MSQFFIGTGFDRHRLEAGRPLVIGGVELDSPVGCVAHSDGDVLLHALTDALLGAAGMGDIGDHFPPSDDRWSNASSDQFVEHALKAVRPRWRITNIDATVFLEAPKLGPHKEAIAESIAQICDLNSGLVNVKAKTGEAVGAIGRGEAIDAHVSLLLQIV